MSNYNMQKPLKQRRLGMKMKQSIGNKTGQVGLTILSVLWIVPIFYLIVQSFRAEPGAWSPTFFPQEWTVDNYVRLFTQTNFPYWYRNTLIVSVISCAITTIFVLAVSYAFSRIRFASRKYMMNIMLTTLENL